MEVITYLCNYSVQVDLVVKVINFKVLFIISENRGNDIWVHLKEYLNIKVLFAVAC